MVIVCWEYVSAIIGTYFVITIVAVVSDFDNLKTHSNKICNSITALKIDFFWKLKAPFIIFLTSTIFVLIEKYIAEKSIWVLFLDPRCWLLLIVFSCFFGIC